MLQTGDKAPYFEGPDQDGRTVRLTDFAGRKLVLYFYPKDSTPGCTAEACDLRDNYQRFLDQGYAVVGVSRDSQASFPTLTPSSSRPTKRGARKRTTAKSPSAPSARPTSSTRPAPSPPSSPK